MSFSGVFHGAFGAEPLEIFCARIVRDGLINREEAEGINTEWENISQSTFSIAALSRKEIITLLVRNNHENLATRLMVREAQKLAESISNGPRECRRGEDNPATYLLSAAMDGMLGEGPLRGASRWVKNRFMLDNWLLAPDVLGCVMSLEEKDLIMEKIRDFGWGDDGAARREAAVLDFSSRVIFPEGIDVEVAGGDHSVSLTI